MRDLHRARVQRANGVRLTPNFTSSIMITIAPCIARIHWLRKIIKIVLPYILCISNSSGWTNDLVSGSLI